MADLLVFDTAGERLVVAAGRDGQAPSVLDVPGGARASEALLPTVMRALAEAGLTLRDLDAIGFGRGPGAFTGVRTACAVAQGLAWGADRPVLLLDDLMALAEDARLRGTVPTGAVVWTLADARMGEVYAACWRPLGDGAWQPLVAPFVASPEAVAAGWQAEAPRAVVGDGVRLLPAGAADGSREPSFDAAARVSPAALWSLAQAAWRAGAAVDAADALPLYVRDKVAQTEVERAQLRAGRALRAAGGDTPQVPDAAPRR